jgi:hypothetical protein
MHACYAAFAMCVDIDYHYRISNLNVHVRAGLQFSMIEVEVFSFMSVCW